MTLLSSFAQEELLPISVCGSWMNVDLAKGLHDHRHCLAFRLLPFTCHHTTFLHIQKPPVVCHRLVLPQESSSQVSFMLSFGGSWGPSMHGRFRHLISFPHDLQEKMFTNIWRLKSPPSAHFCTHLPKSASAARQTPAETVLTTELFMRIPPNGKHHCRVIRALICAQASEHMRGNQLVNHLVGWLNSKEWLGFKREIAAGQSRDSSLGIFPSDVFPDH